MGQSNQRHPAWAGSFYPGDAKELARLITQLAEPRDPSASRLRGIIMPHAGYIYSGYTVSMAAADIRKSHCKTVIILGPDHNVGMATSHISQHDQWLTPLGKITISPETAKLLKNNPELFTNNIRSEQKEHSIEVLLPFLQSWIDHFNLIPIVTGQVDPLPLADTLKPLINKDTLLVASSDLSHFLSDTDAVSKDRATIDAILNMDFATLAENDNKACGLIPIKIVLTLASWFNWSPQLLHYSHSGETSGDHGRVVGYTTIGFYSEEDTDVQ